MILFIYLAGVGLVAGWAAGKKTWGHYQWAWGFANPANQTFGVTKEGVRTLLYHFRTYDQNRNDGLDPQELWIAVNALGVESTLSAGSENTVPAITMEPGSPTPPERELLAQTVTVLTVTF